MGRQGIKVQVEFVSGQPHRPAPRRPRSRRRLAPRSRTCSVRRLRGHPRVLRQRRRPPDGHPGAVDLAAPSSPSSASDSLSRPTPTRATTWSTWAADARRHQDRFMVTAMQILAGTPGLPPSDRKGRRGQTTARGTPRRADRQRQEVARRGLPLRFSASRSTSSSASGREDLQVRRALRQVVLSRACSTPAWSGRRSSLARPVTSISGRREVVPPPPSATRRTASCSTARTALHLLRLRRRLPPNEYRRGFDRMIDIWGADHGYIPRVKGAIAALGLDPPDWTLPWCSSRCSTATARRPISTRSGEFVTLRELRREVGNVPAASLRAAQVRPAPRLRPRPSPRARATRIRYYYVQYAHARLCSVLDRWDGRPPTWRCRPRPAAGMSAELALCARLASFAESWCRTPPPATRRTRSRSTLRISLPDRFP